MRNAIFLLSAAIVLAGTPSSPALAASANLRLPPPKAPQNQIYSPGAIAKSLKSLGYRVEKMKRKGTTYSVTGVGKSGNRVQLTVDGRSGAIVGLAVLQAVPGRAPAVALAMKARRGSRYVDDSTPFGIIIPDIFQTRWTPITSNIWNIFTVEYIPESWAYSGWGYRFAVPYYTVRPGYNGYSVTTFTAKQLGDPIYEVYDYQGTEITTEYSEESFEISAAEEWEERYESQEQQLEESWLDGTIDEVGDVDIAEVADFDSEDGDFDIADDTGDDYDPDLDDDDDDEGEDEEGEEGEAGDEDDAYADDDDPGDEDDSGDYEDDDDGGDDGGDEGYDEGGDDGGDEGYDDGGDEPEAGAVN